MAELDEAEDQFAKKLANVFKQLPLIPDVEIEAVHSSGFCEDRETFHLMLDCTDGRTLLIVVTPGQPLSMGFV